MNKPSSLSVVIPALNEEGNLEPSVKNLLTAMGPYFNSYELLIINDGSTDGTGALAERLAHSNPYIRVIHHERPLGLGASLRQGFDLATQEYVTWYAADDPMDGNSWERIFEQIGNADVLISYMANPEFRPWIRRVLSQIYVRILNLLFGLRIRYYNGFTIYRRELIRSIQTSARGFSILAEVLILALKSGHRPLEIPTYHRQRKQGTSKAFKFSNMKDILKTLLRLIGIVYFKNGKKCLPSSSTAVV